MTVENPPPDVSQFQTEPQDEGVSIDFGRILGTVRKYFWVIVLFLVAGAISAVVYLNVATPIYQSFALLKVEQRVQNTGPSSMAPQTEDLRSLDMIGTIQRGFLTRSLMEEVTRKLKLVDRENFFPKGTPASDRTEAMCLAILMKNTTTRIERGTRFIMVMFDHPDPEIATEVTRALVDNYIALDAEQRVKSAAESISYLKLEVEETKSKLEQSERALTKYAEEVGTVSVDSELNIIASTLLELNSRLTIAKAERLKLAADYEQIELVRDDPDALLQITSIDSTPEVQGLRSELNALDAEIGRVRQRYGPRSPQSIELQDQRAQLMESLRAAALRAPPSVALALRAAAQNEKSLEEAVKAQEKRTMQLKASAVQAAMLERQRDVDRAAYLAVLDSLNRESAEARSQPFFLQIADPASPAYQVAPKPLLVAAIAVVASLAMAAGVIFLISILDTTLKSVDEAELAMGLPVLAAVPQFTESMARDKSKEKKEKKKAGRDQLILPLVEDKHSTVSEAFRTMRASLALLKEDAPSILVTSAIPGEGKSFCSVNLAVALAQQDLRTLLIDADLRKPVVENRLFDTKNEKGLSDFLMGRVDFSEILRDCPQVPNLKVITAGRSFSNPSELLTRKERILALLDEAEGHFDRVVVDSAPVLAVSDTLGLARHFRTIALVIRSHKTARRASRRAVDLLARAGHPPVGMVLNMVPARGSSYYYYYSTGRYGRTYGHESQEVAPQAS
jgi:capsular exopolysaccharide family